MTTTRPDNGRFRDTWPARTALVLAALWAAGQTESSGQEALALLALLGMTPAPPGRTPAAP